MKRGRENQEVGEQKVKEQTAIQREEKTDRTRTVEHATEQRSLKIYLKKTSEVQNLHYKWDC